MGDYYALLGVSPAASGREISAAFRQLAKRLHPDVSPLPGAAERFRRIVEAYETLSDPRRRAAYDATRRLVPAAMPSAASERPPTQQPAQQRTAEGGTRRVPATTAPAAKPARARGPGAPVAPVAPVGAVGALSPGERARRAAEAMRAAAVRGRCAECGALVSGDADRCPACLRKYGTFQEHLARAMARNRRRSSPDG